MKKSLLLLLFIASFLFKGFGHCEPDTLYTLPGFYPDSATGFPPAYATFEYNLVITAVIPPDTLFLGMRRNIDSIGIFTIIGLPEGFEALPNSPSGYWPGGSSGCLLITGTPTSEQVGEYPLQFVLYGYVELIPFPIAFELNYYTLNVLDSVYGGQNIMKVHDATGLHGENITIELEILNDDPFVAFEVHFDLPEGFDYIAGSAVLNPDRKADHLISAGIHGGTGKLVVIAFSLTNAYFTGNSGIVATFSLTTPEIAGTYPLIPENGVIVDIQANNILTGYINGVITLTTGVQILPGDSNCDGEVDVMDVITTISYILGNNPQPFCFENADVNGDGSVNAIDVIGTINIILSGGFVCGVSTITDIDGNVYNTVLIGNQCWMKENLKTTQYLNGTPIEYPGTDNNAWANNTTGAYAWYNNDINWKDSYGALYNWHAVNNTNGLCPAGWHVPSDAEWTQLTDYLVAQGYPNQWNDPNGAGNALKSCRQVNSPLGGDCNTSVHPRWEGHSTHHGFDEFGFSALPGGYRNTTGSFLSIGYYGLWWSSTENSSSDAWFRRMIDGFGRVFRYYYGKSYGFSARCLRDID